MEELGIRPGLYGIVHITEAVMENHDFPLRIRIDETQENSTAFEEMRVSNKEKMRSDLDRLNWSRTLYRLQGDMKRLRKSLVQGRSRDMKRIELEVCAFGRLVSVKCERYIRSLGLAARVSFLQLIMYESSRL